LPGKWRKHTALFVISLITSAVPAVALNVQPVSAATDRIVCTGALPAGCYATIALAVDAAVDGDVVVVPAGEYPIVSTVTINKAISLRGPNADVSGYGTRGAEAIITGTTRLLSVNAKVVIEGLEFRVTTNNDAIYLQGNGDESVIQNNRLIGSGTAPSYQGRGILTTGSPDRVQYRGNYFKNWNTGVVNQATSGAQFINNRFEANFSSMSGDGVSDVTYSGNQFIGNITAISQNETSSGSLIITGNTFSGNTIGPTFRNPSQLGPNTVISGNRFSALADGQDYFRLDATKVSIIGGVINAPGNWWGQSTGPSADGVLLQSGATGQINASPWCSNESCTGVVTPVTGTGATIDDPDLGAPTFSWAPGAVADGATVKVEPITNPAPDATPFKTDEAKLISIQFTGITPPVTICVDGVDPDRLWHFEGGAWKDITNDPAYDGRKVCGTAQSFSPFAIAERGDVQVPDFDFDIDIDLDHYRQPEVSDLPDTGSDSVQTLAMLAAGLTLLGATVILRSRRSRYS
jgi:LPXTG-motif cell wall-anchored protein